MKLSMFKRNKKDKPIKLKEQRISNDVTIIDVEFFTRNLTVKCGPVLKVYNSDPYVRIKVEENTLFIFEKEPKNDENPKNPQYETTLIIPRGYELKEFNASLDKGDLNINILKTKKLDVMVHMGEIKAESLHVTETGSIINKLGNIDIENGNMSNICIMSMIGSINIKGYFTGINLLDVSKGNLSFHSTRKLDELSICAKSEYSIISVEGNEMPEYITEGPEDKVSIYTESGIGVIDYQDLYA